MCGCLAVWAVGCDGDDDDDDDDDDDVLIIIPQTDRDKKNRL